MTRRALALTALPALLLVAGCASAPDGEYPSLAIRDAERVEGSLEPVDAEPYVVPTAPAERVADAAGLLAAAREAHAAFEAALPSAQRVIRAGGGAGPGADSWGRAQVALADLESHRSRLMISLADLDRLYLATETEGLAPGGIAEARDSVIAMMDQETAVIEPFQDLLSR